MTNSAEASASYTIVRVVATPTFSPAAGTYVGSVAVALSTTTSDATIHYTTDGSAPTTASPVYTSPVTLTRTTTIRAIAVASGMADSAEASALYTLQAVPPVFSPAGGTFSQPQSVTLSTTTGGATIHYTIDGSTPTTASPVYSSPIAVTQSRTIRAIAVAAGMMNSIVASASYTILQAAATPTFSPAAGTYVGSVAVTISTTTSGATIHYTTDGSAPTPASPVYASPVTLTRTTTIRAIAVASGMANSAVASALYTLQAVPPVFSPAAGTYVGSVAVTLSTTTGGATIHYTMDGSLPTTASPVYASPVTLTRTTTIRAIAVASGMANSAVASALYTLQAVPPVFSPASGTFSQPQSVTLSTSTSGAAIHYTIDGSTPTTASPVYSGPIAVTQSRTIRAITAASGMVNSTVASATYTLQAAAPTFSPPGGSFVAPQFVSLSSASPGATIHYTRDGSTPTTASPVYDGPILVITTTTIRAIAVIPGWTQSAVASATYSFLLF
jgi:hypothetical protein